MPITQYTMPRQNNDGKSGVRISYYTAYENIVGLNVDASGQVVGITMAASAKWNVLNHDKEIALFKEDAIGELGTSRAVTQTFTFNWRKLSIINRHALQTLTHLNGFVMIHVDWNGNRLLQGATGAFLTGDATQTGTKFGELTGSQVTIIANEPYKAYYVNDSAFASLTIED